jgi:uncharacterized protein (DUF302 family)
MRRFLFATPLLLVIAGAALADHHDQPAGLVTLASHHDVATTADRLVAAIEAKGITLFARIDHGANAGKVGNDLAPMQLLIFGKAQMGTALMQGGSTIGIDLPLKALVWEDAEGRTHVSYNDPAYLAARHHVVGGDAVVTKMQTVLAGLAKKATE